MARRAALRRPPFNLIYEFPWAGRAEPDARLDLSVHPSTFDGPGPAQRQCICGFSATFVQRAHLVRNWTGRPARRMTV